MSTLTTPSLLSAIAPALPIRTPIITPLVDIVALPIYRLTVGQYHAMIRAGILTEDDAVELLEGCLVTKMPKNPPHRIATQTLRDKLVLLLPSGWFVDDQEPVMTDDSEPEPDIQVVRGKRTDYSELHPGPSDTALVVEVSESSLARDRKVKLRIFARARMPIFWIINLVDRCVEVYTDPTGPAEEPTYRQRQVYGPDDSVPVMLDGQEVGRIAVRDLLA